MKSAQPGMAVPHEERSRLIGTAAVAVEFKTDATVVQEVPAALAERLVD